MSKNIAFHEPLWFILLGIIPMLMLIFWYYIRHRYPVFVVSQLSGITGFRLKELLAPPYILLCLRMLTILLLVLGLADLKSAREIKKTKPAQGIDMVLAMDISGSMMLEDIKPNRLEALKDVLTGFIAQRAQDRFGLVLYAGESINWCPITQDYGFLLAKLNEMEHEALADGTAIGVGLASAVNAIKHSKAKSKVIILLTDGENNTGFVHPFTASEIAKKHQIKVYTIGIGTTGMAPMPFIDFNGNKAYRNVPVKIDEVMLTKIAAHTGGSYYRAKDAKALQNIYREIDRLEKSPAGIKIETVYQSEFQIFLLMALVVFMLEMLLKFTRYRNLAS